MKKAWIPEKNTRSLNNIRIRRAYCDQPENPVHTNNISSKYEHATEEKTGGNRTRTRLVGDVNVGFAVIVKETHNVKMSKATGVVQGSITLAAWVTVPQQ